MPLCTRRERGEQSAKGYVFTKGNNLLAEAVEGEAEEDVVDIDGGAALGDGVKVVGDDLGLLDKDIACVVYREEKAG
jgi:hypothetical protein